MTFEKIRARLVRLEQSPEGALGALCLDGKYFCSTLEPDKGDPERNQIPPGTYQCRRFHGKKFKNTFEIIVPNHTAVLFHPGNTEADTTMCVLLGRYPGYLREHRAVLNSGYTFKQFMNYFEDTDHFLLEIRECYGGTRWP